MQRSLFSKRALVSAAALFFLLAATLCVSIFVSRASASTNNSYVSVSGSYIKPPVGTHLLGAHPSNRPMTITLVLHPNISSKLSGLLSALYNPKNPQFHHWLAQGEFNRMFAPPPARIASVKGFLTQAGFKLAASSTPFMIRAVGSTAQVEAAFHTTINNYKSARGQSFFENNSAIQIPASLSDTVVGLSGVTNLGELQPHFVTTRQAAKAEGKAVPRYGAGPGGSGLTPSQTSTLYGAGPIYRLGNVGKGQGAKLAVFELSGYTQADIKAYESKFLGPRENVRITNVNVDGGPVTPACPTGDECGPFSAGPCANGCDSADYSGDIEVNADIETQIAIAPNISSVTVYNAPNDELSITSTDEYFKIANDDIADSISTSWGECEDDLGATAAEGESIAFIQMATQGQSIFDAAGDTGAFDCLLGSGLTNLNAEDPSTQPFVTSVGGTSLGTYDPGNITNPAYPSGAETVWNVGDACNSGNLSLCSLLGAGGGGVSTLWTAPSFQNGPGVISSFSKKSPFCSMGSSGSLCREVPDVSANADETTPYAEYCTGNAATNSTCATFSSSQPAKGWFGIGGTSLSSPLWSGVIAIWDSVHRQRFGSASFGLYQMFRTPGSYSNYFHDITGSHQTENNNGYYPTTPNYDMATGIGSPRLSNIAKYNF